MLAFTADLWINRDLRQPVAPFPLAFAAVIAGAAWAGFGPGIFATALGTVWGVFLLHQQGYDTPGIVIRCIGFIFEGLLLSIGSARLRRATQRAKKGEEWHRNLVETSNEGIWIIDSTGTIGYANPRVAEILGHRSAELLGRKASDFFVAEDLPMERVRSQNRRLGRREQFDRRLRRTDGTEAWVLACCSPLRDDTGDGVGVLEMLTDITERKHAEQALRLSEQRFRGLFENVLEGVYQTTPDGRILSANPMLLTMLGMVTASEMNDVNIARDLYVDPGVRRRLLDRLEHEGSFQNVEYQLRRRDGEIITVRENARAVRDEQGQITYYEGTLSDVTEQIHIESELLRARSRDSVEAVAGSMPHEFRNILTVISGYSRLLLEDLPEDHPARTAARGIARTVEEAEALTAQLAAFSDRPDRAMIDINRVLLFSDGSPRRNLSPWSLPIHADTDDIQQIVSSLTRDAQEVTADAVNIDQAFTRAHAGSRAGLFARITVRDFGPDVEMAPEAADAVLKCGGFVLNSDSGRTVYLPIAEGAARFLTSRVSAPRPCETVLLVQEEPLIREVSRDLLERLGYGVLLAEDAAEAERITDQGYRFDLVIADMYETSVATELVDGLKRVRPGLKGIVITGKAPRREFGGDGYLERPFSSESLNNEIRRILK